MTDNYDERTRLLQMGDRSDGGSVDFAPGLPLCYRMAYNYEMNQKLSADMVFKTDIAYGVISTIFMWAKERNQN